VYVNYNLRIQNKLDGGYRRDDDDDPFDRLMELTLSDENNPIKEWMEFGRSTKDPVLDEEDTESDCPLPSRLVTDTVDTLDCDAKLDHKVYLSGHGRPLVTLILAKGRRPLCYLQGKVREARAKEKHRHELIVMLAQRMITLVQHTKNQMIVALVQMVLLVVVEVHREAVVVCNRCLPSLQTNENMPRRTQIMAGLARKGW